MAGKQSSPRRRSTSTTAPTAPLASSSHMNQKRDWPGVPNRYRISCSSTVMRPKSIATVVVFLSGTAAVSSIPTDSEVMCCSVVRGGISDTAPTKVVLPAPNPPATRSLSGISSRPAGGGGRRRVSTRTESIEQPSQNLMTGAAVTVGGSWQVDLQVAAVGQVADEHPGHPDRDPQGGPDLGQGPGPGTQLDNRPRLGLEGGPGAVGQPGGPDHRLQGKLLAGGAGPSPGEGVHRHHPVDLAAVGRRHRPVRSAGPVGAGRRPGVSMCPTRRSAGTP